MAIKVRLEKDGELKNAFVGLYWPQKVGQINLTY